MSAFKKIKCNIVDKNNLIKALEILGFTPEIHEEPQNLLGYRNDGVLVINVVDHFFGGRF